MKESPKHQIVLTLKEWIDLTSALEATPNIEVSDLTRKARRLVEARKRNGREVVKLENQLLKRCPDLDS